jgi:hypothetical protein
MAKSQMRKEIETRFRCMVDCIFFSPVCVKGAYHVSGPAATACLPLAVTQMGRTLEDKRTRWAPLEACMGIAISWSIHPVNDIIRDCASINYDSYCSF